MGDRSFGVRGRRTAIRALVGLARKSQRNAGHLHSRHGKCLDHHGKTREALFTALQMGKVRNGKSSPRWRERGAGNPEARGEAIFGVLGERVLDGSLWPW